MHSIQILLILSTGIAAGWSAQLNLLEVSVTGLSNERIQQFSLRQNIQQLHQSKQLLECALVAAKHLLSDQYLVFIGGDSTHEPDCFITTQTGSLHRKLQASPSQQIPCCIRVFVHPLSKFWLTIQHRVDSSVSFYRSWTEYAEGSGHGPDANYWIGLRTLHSLTSSTPRQLRVRMKLWNNTEYWADYASFSVTNEADKFRLSVSGYSAGRCNPRDSLNYHNGMQFSTYDSDNDLNLGNCAIYFKGGWWYRTCHFTNPNGLYYNQQQAMSNPHDPKAITWYTMLGSYYPLMEIEMLLKI